MTRGPRITVGGCGPVRDVDDLPAAHDDGARTVAALIALGRAYTGAAARELGFAGLIVGSDPDVQDYVDSVLGPALNYDRERGSDLVGTLAAYFAVYPARGTRPPNCTSTSTPWPSASRASRRCSVTTGSTPTGPWRSSSPYACAVCSLPERRPARPKILG